MAITRIFKPEIVLLDTKQHCVPTAIFIFTHQTLQTRQTTLHQLNFVTNDNDVYRYRLGLALVRLLNNYSENQLTYQHNAMKHR